MKAMDSFNRQVSLSAMYLFVLQLISGCEDVIISGSPRNGNLDGIYTKLQTSCQHKTTYMREDGDLFLYYNQAWIGQNYGGYWIVYRSNCYKNGYTKAAARVYSKSILPISGNATWYVSNFRLNSSWIKASNLSVRCRTIETYDPDSDPESESSSVKAVIICGVTVGVGVPGMCVTVWCIIVCCMQRKNECQDCLHKPSCELLRRLTRRSRNPARNQNGRPNCGTPVTPTEQNNSNASNSSMEDIEMAPMNRSSIDLDVESVGESVQTIIEPSAPPESPAYEFDSLILPVAPSAPIDPQLSPPTYHDVTNADGAWRFPQFDSDPPPYSSENV